MHESNRPAAIKQLMRQLLESEIFQLMKTEDGQRLSCYCIQPADRPQILSFAEGELEQFLWKHAPCWKDELCDYIDLLNQAGYELLVKAVIAKEIAKEGRK